MKITVQNRPSYGKDRIYPVNGKAMLFLSLIKPRTTFSRDDLQTISDLGFEIEYVIAPL